MVQTEKLRAASAIGANLAHELRTPLASIGALSKGAGNLLPILTDAYEKAKAAGMEVGPLRKNQVEILSNTLGTIRNEVEYSNTIIDMLLVNTADKSLSDVDMDIFSVRDAAEEAVRRYPFNNQRERNLIRVEIDADFELQAPRLLVIHVLFNLIKNALYFVQQAGKGDISIRAEHDSNYGRVLVHDTGSGIPVAIRSHIFDRFYTTTHTGQGAGIGLSFCKLVMDSIGGSIYCESEEGEYATFTLEFPKFRV
jgi:two-component system CAI-1 autoinducer sensor kinase/phosphatase CqsS